MLPIFGLYGLVVRGTVLRLAYGHKLSNINQ